MGYRKGGVDFDELFDPDVMGDGPVAAGLRRNGVALRYAALAYGVKRADVGYRQGGIDVSNLWAAKGTAMYSLPINGQLFEAVCSVPFQQSGSASVRVYIRANGTYEVVRARVPGAAYAPITGTWLPAGQSAADYSVRFVLTHLGSNAVGTVENTATTVQVVNVDRYAGVSIGPNGHASGTRTAAYQLVIQLQRAGSTVSTTTVTIEAETDGSA